MNEKILKEIINYEAVAENRRDFFRIEKINNLVRYFINRNSNLDIEDIKSEIITSIITIINSQKIKIDFYEERSKYINFLCKALLNNLSILYKKNNNYLYREKIELITKEETEFANILIYESNAVLNELIEKETKEEKKNNIEEQWNENIYDISNLIKYLDFILKNKEKLLSEIDIKLLEETMYKSDYEDYLKNYFKANFNKKDFIINNKINTLYRRLNTKYLYWIALEQIDIKDVYIEGLKLLFKRDLKCNIVSIYDLENFKLNNNNKNFIKIYLKLKLWGFDNIKYDTFNGVRLIDIKSIATNIYLHKCRIKKKLVKTNELQ